MSRGRGDETLDAGHVFAGAYRIESQLGSGGFGAVYRAVHLATSRAVALKVMHVRLEDSEAETKRFLREAEWVRRLEHPHIVKTIEFGHVPGGQPFIALELLSGEPLDQRLKRAGRLSVETAVLITAQTLSALAAAHEVGLAHRDIKPANVFLCAGDHVKVLDFGLAKVFVADGTDMTELTAMGTILGTPSYLAPEQVRTCGVDHRSDLYSVGLVLAELLTGERLVKAERPIDRLFAHASASEHELPPALAGSPLAAVIARAIKKKQAERFQTAGEMLAAMQAAVGNTVTPSNELGAPRAAGGTILMPATLDESAQRDIADAPSEVHKAFAALAPTPVPVATPQAVLPPIGAPTTPLPDRLASPSSPPPMPAPALPVVRPSAAPSRSGGGAWIVLVLVLTLAGAGVGVAFWRGWLRLGAEAPASPASERADVRLP